MSFVSVNSEKRHNRKLRLVSASLCNGKYFKGKQKGRLARWECKECGCLSCVISPTISIIYLPFKCLTSGLCVVWGAIHSTKISGNLGLKPNGSIEKKGPPFEVDHFSRSDWLELRLNGLRPWFRNYAHCIQSGFSLLLKEAKIRQWKAVKNILKVNWIENKNISASYARENN